MILAAIIDYLISLGYVHHYGHIDCLHGPMRHGPNEFWAIELYLTSDNLQYDLATGEYGSFEYADPDFFDKIAELTATGRIT